MEPYNIYRICCTYSAHNVIIRQFNKANAKTYSPNKPNNIIIVTSIQFYNTSIEFFILKKKSN